MGISDISSRSAIFQAIDEFNQLGGEAFFDKYGFGPAREYFLEINKCLYPSKAIIGVAHKFQFPNKGQLQSHEFNGGKPVKKKLEKLGFTVTVKPQ